MVKVLASQLKANDVLLWNDTATAILSIDSSNSRIIKLHVWDFVQGEADSFDAQPGEEFERLDKADFQFVDLEYDDGIVNALNYDDGLTVQLKIDRFLIDGLQEKVDTGETAFKITAYLLDDVWHITSF